MKRVYVVITVPIYREYFNVLYSSLVVFFVSYKPPRGNYYSNLHHHRLVFPVLEVPINGITQ